jgi:hypothetical protein
VYNEQRGMLVAGGAFTTVGGQSTDRVAIWNGTQWKTRANLGIGGTVNELVVNPADPDTLLAVGDFTAGLRRLGYP